MGFPVLKGHPFRPVGGLTMGAGLVVLGSLSRGVNILNIPTEEVELQFLSGGMD